MDAGYAIFDSGGSVIDWTSSNGYVFDFESDGGITGTGRYISRVSVNSNGGKLYYTASNTGATKTITSMTGLLCTVSTDPTATYSIGSCSRYKLQITNNATDIATYSVSPPLKSGGYYYGGTMETLTVTRRNVTPDLWGAIKITENTTTTEYSSPREYSMTEPTIVISADKIKCLLKLYRNYSSGDGTHETYVVTIGSSSGNASATFTRSGYTLTGWNTKRDGSGTAYSDNQALVLSDDLTLYAQWRANVTLTYDANGGGAMAQSTQTGYGYVTLLPAPSRSGYDFLGWSINGSLLQPGALYNLTADATATARWNGVTIRVSKTCASVADVSQAGRLRIVRDSDGEVMAQEYVNPQTGARAGSVEYSDGSPYSTYRVECVMENRSPDGLYKANGVPGCGSNNVPYDEATGTPGYAYVSPSYPSPPTTMRTILLEYVMVRRDLYGVRVMPDVPGMDYTATAFSPENDASGGGPVPVPRWAQGRGVTFTLTAAEGYDFEKVSVCSTGNPSAASPSIADFLFDVAGGGGGSISVNVPRISCDVLLYPKLKVRTYTLTAARHAASAAAITSVSVSPASVAHGGSATFTATLEQTGDWYFDGWYDDDGALVSDAASYTVQSVTSDIKLTARASVRVGFRVDYPQGTDAADKTCALTVNGDSLDSGEYVNVRLGEDVSFELSGLGAGAGDWKLDGWYDGYEEGDVLLPFAASGSYTPSVSRTLAARVATDVSHALRVHIGLVGESTYLSAAGYPGAVAADVVEGYYELSSGNLLSADSSPFTFTYEGAKWVRVRCLRPVIQVGDDTKVFAGLWRLDADTLQPEAQPLTRALSAMALVNSDVYLAALYAAPAPVSFGIAFAEGCAGRGRIRIDGSTDTGATFAADRLSATVTQGYEVTLRADPRPGYRFAGWSLSPDGGGDLAQSPYTVIGADTLYAVFADDGGASVWEWEGSDTPKTMVWESKTYESGQPVSPAACRVDARGYDGDAAGRSLELGVKMFSSPDGDARSLPPIPVRSQDARRLPQIRAERYMRVRVVSDAEVDALIVSTSMQGLR